MSKVGVGECYFVGLGGGSTPTPNSGQYVTFAFVVSAVSSVAVF